MNEYIVIVQEGEDELNRWNFHCDAEDASHAEEQALSPENLTCDGELSASQVRARYKALTKAAAELQKIDPSVTFYEFA